MIASLQAIPTSKVKTIRKKKSLQSKERFGIIDSGATHNVREIKDEEDVQRLTPTEVLVAFDQKIQKGLFINQSGTVIGPKGTESIISMNEVIKIGYEVKSTKDEVIVSKGGKILPIHVKDGAPIMTQEACLELIEEIEREKEAQKNAPTKEVKLKEIWPRVKSA